MDSSLNSCKWPRDIALDWVLLLKDIRCIIKDTKNMVESSDDKRLNKSPLGIAMNIGFGSNHTSKE
jgi:hypothetical protein